MAYNVFCNNAILNMTLLRNNTCFSLVQISYLKFTQPWRHGRFPSRFPLAALVSDCSSCPYNISIYIDHFINPLSASTPATSRTLMISPVGSLLFPSCIQTLNAHPSTTTLKVTTNPYSLGTEVNFKPTDTHTLLHKQSYRPKTYI